MSHRGQNRSHLARLMVSGHAYDCDTPRPLNVSAHITSDGTGARNGHSARPYV